MIANLVRPNVWINDINNNNLFVNKNDMKLQIVTDGFVTKTSHRSSWDNVCIQEYGLLNSKHDK